MDVRRFKCSDCKSQFEIAFDYDKVKGQPVRCCFCGSELVPKLNDTTQAYYNKMGES